MPAFTLSHQPDEAVIGNPCDPRWAKVYCHTSGKTYKDHSIPLNAVCELDRMD